MAIFAYLTALRVGFLSDDIVLSYLAQQPGVDTRAFLPGSQWYFYRPVGVLLIWELGWQLWGYNPLPYHVIGLLLHAGVSLLLGLWLADLTRRRSLGWIAGALFGVFPFHMEAVAWVSGHWDVLATLFGIGSLWLFTSWWRIGIGSRQIEGEPKTKRRLYLLSVLLYGLAIFSKESLFAFLLALGAAAWYVAPPQGRKGWLRLGYALLPYVALVSFNVLLRFVTIGGLGIYAWAKTEYADFVWDQLTGYVRPLLSPINVLVLGRAIMELTGLASMVALLVGLTLYGHSQRRLLLVAGVWIVAAIIPVLSIPLPAPDDLQNYRYLYLVACGYCILVATLLRAALDALAGARRTMLVVASGVALFLSIVAAWAQLRPWHTATVQANDVIDTLLHTIPPPSLTQQRANGMVWYVENVPDVNKGAPTLNRGLGIGRAMVTEGDFPRVVRVARAEQAPVSEGEADTFAMRFLFDENLLRFRVDYAVGITAESAPPTPPSSLPPIDAGSGLLLWDFRSCAPAVVEKWHVFKAEGQCETGTGLALHPTGEDPQMLLASEPNTVSELTSLAWSLDSRSALVRLRVSAAYLSTTSPRPYVSEWYWTGQAQEGMWSQQRSRSVGIKQDGKSHTYWTFLRADEVGNRLSGLRFDPINTMQAAEINWIAVDIVK